MITIPRGNDTQDAVRELVAQFGPIQNVEDLIVAHRARRDKSVQAASMQSVDQEATKDLDVSDVNNAVDGADVVSAAVRGGKVVYVARDSMGRAFKGVLEQGSLKKSGPTIAEREVEAAQARREGEALPSAGHQGTDTATGDQSGEETGETGKDRDEPNLAPTQKSVARGGAKK